jgi:NAD(P)-dependent dehydrogenase (short-subunit alcohol dehydrogenase family)
MENKVVVITGATSGIGQTAAEQLASMGARIVQIARDRSRAQTALAHLQNANSKVEHSVYYADLSLVREMKRVGAEIAAAEPRIDVLINNAGALFSARTLTDEGLEKTFALNHLSYFVLTRCLIDTLKASTPSRIVNTASDAHALGVVDFDDLGLRKAYDSRSLAQTLRFGGPAFKVYAKSKLYNVLFTRELARRLEITGVIANCVHPGFVATRFADHAGGMIGFGTKIAKRFARPVEKGAETVVFLASSTEAACFTGQYFSDCQAVPASAAAQDDEVARRLWDETEKLLATL